MRGEGTLAGFQRMLRREEAAAYLAMSPTKFSEMVKAGRYPRPVQLTEGVKRWDRIDLDATIAALKEAQEAAQESDPNPWDTI